MPDTAHEGHAHGQGEIASRISTGAVQLLSEYTGRGPTKAHTILNQNSVTIVLQDTLTKGERSLAARGKQEEVIQTRYAYQQVMAGDLSQLVEQSVGRNVRAFMSANHIDPDVAVEFFLLEPDGNEAISSSPNRGAE